MQIYFLQPVLIIFTRGAINSVYLLHFSQPVLTDIFNMSTNQSHKQCFKQ